jgi:release factor glutamine methyltransferase
MTARTWTTLELLKTTTDFFAGKGLPNARLAAERLLAHAWDCRRVDLYLRTEHDVDEKVLETYRGLARAYAAGQPMQYVIGATEFMGLPFAVDRRVLIPRPETELLVDAVVKRLRPASETVPPTILELGTGSGAVAVALASQLRTAEIWTTEASSDAAQLASRNARRNKVEDRVHVLVMDRFEALSPDLAGAMRCIVSNPPYVTTDEMTALPPVVREHEPHQALHGGPEGLDFYRYLCSQGLQFLSPGGILALEIGAGQGAAVTALCREAGLHDVSLSQDYAGLDRIVVASK